MVLRNSHTLFVKRLSILFLGILIVAIAGFYNSYFKFFPFFNGEISAPVHLHAFFMMVWLLLLIAQPLLIISGRRTLHRVLGEYSWIIVLFIIFSTGLLVIESYSLDASKGVPIKANIAVRSISIITIVSFVTFYLMAMKYKSNMAVHARYIIGTGLTVIPASATRLFYFIKVNSILAELSSLLTINFLVLALIIRDKRKEVNIKERPYQLILAFQLFLTFYYCLLLGLSIT